MATDTIEPILVVRGLDAGYEDLQVLHEVSVEVPRGSIVSMIGPNGAGKSTLLKAVYGLAVTTAGTVSFQPAGDRPLDITGRAPYQITAAGMNYVPQRANVFPNLTVAENLEMGAVLARRWLAERMESVFELFPVLAERPQQRAGSLSGGERQMLALGRSLMTDPQLLLLDEPSAGLAPTVIDEVMERLVEINSRGVSLLMVEQNARRSLAMSTYGYVLETGRNRMEGEGVLLLEDPNVVDLYLGG
jgi:ABC-type branched-subunit amino acid transport system ATPase component